MSQEKVDQYKKNKANRKKIMRREKWTLRLEIFVGVVVLAALVGWFSFAVYKNVQSNAENATAIETTSLNLGAVEDYMSELSDTVSASEE